MEAGIFTKENLRKQAVYIHETLEAVLQVALGMAAASFFAFLICFT